jgi:hypothetical protein
LERAHAALAHGHAERWEAFYDGFAALVRADEERRRAWVAVLLEEVAKAIADPAALLFSPGKHHVRILKAQMHGWASVLDPLAAWDRRCRADINFRGKQPFFHLSLLLCVDPVAWCSAVNTLPLLDMMDAALVHYTHLKEDRALIEELLAIAPPVFDAEGKWDKSRSVVALLLTQRIIHHASSQHQALSARVHTMLERNDPGLGSAQQALAQAESEELPAWLRKVFGILLARSDGKYIALRFLAYLTREELLGDGRFPRQTWRAEQHAFHVLAEVLTSAGLGVRDARDAWSAAEAIAQQKHERETKRRLIRRGSTRKVEEDPGEGAQKLHGEGFPLLLGAALMLGQAPAQEERVAFWGFFERLLVERDTGLSLALRDSTHIDAPRRIGFLLSMLPDPGATFRQTYIRLEPQRRRSMREYTYEGFDHDLGSVLLLRVGLDAIVQWLGQAQPSMAVAQARELFWWIYEAARRLWLTAQHDLEEKRELVCLCFAFMPIVFADELGKALRRAIPPIANDAWMVSAAGYLLSRNGVTPQRLGPLLREAGADLEAALRDAYQWAKLTEDTSIPRPISEQNPDFPTDFEDFARALNLSLDEPAAEPPPQTERTLRRAELAARIP